MASRSALSPLAKRPTCTQYSPPAAAGFVEGAGGAARATAGFGAGSAFVAGSALSAASGFAGGSLLEGASGFTAASLLGAGSDLAAGSGLAAGGVTTATGAAGAATGACVWVIAVSDFGAWISEGRAIGRGSGASHSST